MLLAVVFAGTLAGAARGQVAPRLDALGSDGRPVRLANLAGRVVVVDFWASWCEPCRASFPCLERLARTYGPRGLTVVGVGVDDERALFDRFVRETRPTFPVVHDADHSIAEGWSPETMPTTYVLGRDGRVRAVFTGAVDDARLETAIREALEVAR